MHSNQKRRDYCTLNPLFQELVDRGLASSCGEARRLVRAGWVFIDEDVATDEAMAVTSLTFIRVQPGMEFALSEGFEGCSGQKVDPLDAAEGFIVLLCSDILRELCTTGHLTPETYATLSDLAVGQGALKEMIEECRFGPVMNQKGRP
ncbi:hypothetical protein JCM25156A_00280 [Komagataeibacter kakiaceti JCM 25156]|uniref:hypothetical protein n=1 Tax=Komagataeibacter kakiaceti TaxID=943261 RepID=UPI0004705CEA|nr:hypothetical protein [Komagataeibacter kakiaceti]